MACWSVLGASMPKYYTKSTCVSTRLLPLQPKTLKIFEFKGLIGKIFRNKDLTQNPSLFPQSRQKLAQDFGSGMTPVHHLNRAVAGLCPARTGQSPVTTRTLARFVRPNEKRVGSDPAPFALDFFSIYPLYQFQPPTPPTFPSLFS